MTFYVRLTFFQRTIGEPFMFSVYRICENLPAGRQFCEKFFLYFPLISLMPQIKITRSFADYNDIISFIHFYKRLFVYLTFFR